MNNQNEMTKEVIALLSLWCATFSKYESWKANGADPRDYPNNVIADYRELEAVTKAILKRLTE